MTTVLHNPHSCCPPAIDCPCCTHKIRGIFFTLTGASEGDPGCDGGDCTRIDGDYYVPALQEPEEECRGNTTFDLGFDCNDPPSPQYVRIRWEIWCEELDEVLAPGQLMLQVYVYVPPTDAEMRYRNIINAPGGTFPTDCTPVDDQKPMGDRTHLGWPVFTQCSLDGLNVTAELDMAS